MSTMKATKFAISYCFLFFAALFLSSCGNNTASSEGTTAETTTEGASSNAEYTNANFGQPTIYQLRIRTGCKDDGGTKAKVSAVIIGSEGKTDELTLDLPTKEVFLSCSQDVFDIPVDKDLGDIKEVKIWHDDTGEDPSWLVEVAEIKNQKTGIRWMFPCGKWMGKEHRDGSSSLSLFPGKNCN